MKRTPFSFVNAHGLRVKGMVFEAPEGKNAKTGIVYLPGIVLGMTAVHRLGVDICCAFQSADFPSLLFSPSRVGESEGELFSGSGEEFGNFIKDGGFVDDTQEAIAAFCSARMLDDVILVGHCGGALTALYTAEKNDCVKKAILISPPLIGEIQQEAPMTGGQSKELAILYRHKLFSAEAWKRFFAGKSDYRQILRMIRSRTTGRSFNGDDGRINKRLLRGLESAAKKMDIKILYGDHDPGIEEFRSYRDLFQKWNIRIQIFPDTSHGFVTDESMRLLMDELLSS